MFARWRERSLRLMQQGRKPRPTVPVAWRDIAPGMSPTFWRGVERRRKEAGVSMRDIASMTYIIRTTKEQHHVQQQHQQKSRGHHR